MKNNQVTFLDNANYSTSLLYSLKELIPISKEIFIAVAFLKSSGLDLVLPDFQRALKKGTKIKIICGLDFGLTDPEALESLLNLFEKYQGSILYCAEGDNNIFHTKMYFFRNSTQANIIVGSSNFTGGGIQDNFELSLRYDCFANSETAKQAYCYFENLVNSHNVFKASHILFEKYKGYANKERAKRQKLKKKPEGADKDDVFSLNTKKIKQSYDNYVKYQKPQRNFAAKRENYEEARRILDEIASSKLLNKSEFYPLYASLVGGANSIKLWDSGGINRSINKVTAHWRKFQNLVRYVKKNHHKLINVVFKDAMVLSKNIPGVGINILSEILTTYDFEKYPVVNNSPIEALKYFGCNVKNKVSFDGNYYREFSRLMNDIKELLNTDTLLEVDGFFNYIYWKVKKHKF